MEAECASVPESTSSTSGFVLESSSESSAAPSLLSRLCAPQPLDLARKRRIKCNPSGGTKKGKGSVVGDPKTVLPVDRVKAYPEEHFTVSNKKLFCLACREELALKKSVRKPYCIPKA